MYNLVWFGSGSHGWLGGSIARWSATEPCSISVWNERRCRTGTFARGVVGLGCAGACEPFRSVPILLGSPPAFEHAV